MVRKSNQSRSEILNALREAVPAFQDATDEVDDAATAHLGMNRTDMRCLGVLLRSGTISASELADASGLTRGAMTTALDRMEDAGYVKRVRDTEDRRGVRVEVTAAARRKADAIYGPIADEGGRLLSKYSTTELAAVLRFLQDARELQHTHVERIRNLRSSKKR